MNAEHSVYFTIKDIGCCSNSNLLLFHCAADSKTFHQSPLPQASQLTPSMKAHSLPRPWAFPGAQKHPCFHRAGWGQAALGEIVQKITIPDLLIINIIKIVHLFRAKFECLNPNLNFSLNKSEKATWTDFKYSAGN